MDLELVVKAMSKLSNDFSLDDYTDCVQIFEKYIHRIIKNKVKDMPCGTRYAFIKYDSSIQTFISIYEDNNIALRVAIPIDCSYIDVSQIISARETEGYVSNIETIQNTQKQLREVIVSAISPITEVINELK